MSDDHFESVSQGIPDAYQPGFHPDPQSFLDNSFDQRSRRFDSSASRSRSFAGYDPGGAQYGSSRGSAVRNSEHRGEGGREQSIYLKRSYQIFAIF